MTTTQAIEGLNDLSINGLVQVYNHFCEKPVNKFADKRTALQRTHNAIDEAQQDAVTFNKKVGKLHPTLTYLFKQDTCEARFDRLTAKEREVLKAIYLCWERADKLDKELFQAVTIKSVHKLLGGKEEVLRKILDTLGGIKMLDVRNNNSISLFPSTIDWAKSQPKFSTDKMGIDLDKSDWHAPGPRSPKLGKRIYKLVEGNPRKEGSLGWHSWNLLKEGMTFEEYRRAGGRCKDLDWDLSKSFVEIK